MKPITTVIFILFSSHCFCQDDYYIPEKHKTSSEAIIPKGTYKILIKTDLSKDANIQLIGSTLAANDYQIDRMNEGFGLIQTTPKPHGNMNASYTFNIVAMDGAIMLTGTYILNISIEIWGVRSDPGLSMIRNIGQRGSVNKSMFEMMYGFATKLSDPVNLQYMVR